MMQQDFLEPMYSRSGDLRCTEGGETFIMLEDPGAFNVFGELETFNAPKELCSPRCGRSGDPQRTGGTDIFNVLEEVKPSMCGRS